MIDRLRELPARPDLRTALLPWVTGKVLTLAAVGAALWYAGVNGQWLDHIRQVALGWDARSYVEIADSGYPAGLDYHDAFLPGYPLLIRGVSYLTADSVAAALLISAVASLIAIAAVARLAAVEQRAADASFAAWCFALAPLGLFLSAAYTESTFLAAAGVSLVLARQGRIKGASVAAAVAVATRITGLILIPVLIFEVVRHRTRWQQALSILLVPVPFALYCIYMQVHIGDARAFFDAQSLPSFGGHHLDWPWNGLRETWATLQSSTDDESRSVWLRELIFGAVGAAACLAAWIHPRFSRSLALYCTLALVVATSLSFWLSVPRYLLALFPIVLLIADLTRRWPVARGIVLAVSAELLCWGSFIYGEGHWLS